MCNDYRSNVDVNTIAEEFSGLKIKIRFSEGIPNLQPRDDIKITEVAPIVRSTGEPGTADLVQRRWSWPGSGGKPVYNFKSDNREFTTGRCLIIADGFYEFTTPADPKKKRKDKWLFTFEEEQPFFCIAGIWRTEPSVGEAFTMLTMPPGPDIAPYHDRQIALLAREEWAAWLNPTVSAKQILKPLSAGSLSVKQVG